jgi:hypothetical protein
MYKITQPLSTAAFIVPIGLVVAELETANVGDAFAIEPVEVSQEQLDVMGEFDGW